MGVDWQRSYFGFLQIVCAGGGSKRCTGGAEGIFRAVELLCMIP